MILLSWGVVYSDRKTESNNTHHGREVIHVATGYKCLPTHHLILISCTGHFLTTGMYMYMHNYTCLYMQHKRSMVVDEYLYCVQYVLVSTDAMYEALLE